VFAFWQVPGDSHDRGVAEDVSNRGGTVSAIAVEVNVDYEAAKGGGWHEVDQVRVRLSEMGPWRDLDAVANEDTLSEDLDWDEGWQPATDDTGYNLPLSVMVTHDSTGHVQHVVAERDIDYWTNDNLDPEIGLFLGSGSLLVGFGGSFAYAAFTGRDRHRHDHSRYPGSTRAERRRALERDEHSDWVRRKRKRRR
jgi:hypothetical protein